MLHCITQYAIMVLSTNLLKEEGDKTMTGRPKTKRGQKVNTALKSTQMTKLELKLWQINWNSLYTPI